ncbi:hypothetical protein FQZ97_848080 [compost metagenome]
MGECRRRDHIGCAGADGGSDSASAFATELFGIGNGCVSHGLLIVATPCNELIADAMKRLAKPCDIAMAENSPDTSDEGISLWRHLIGYIAHKSLCRCQSNGFHLSSRRKSAFSQSHKTGLHLCQRCAYFCRSLSQRSQKPR